MPASRAQAGSMWNETVSSPLRPIELECCNFYGDPNTIYLPYSRIGGSIAAVRWNRSHDVFDRRSEMSPDVPVQLTAAAYFAGRDAALESIFKLISEQPRR